MYNTDSQFIMEKDEIFRYLLSVVEPISDSQATSLHQLQ